MTGEGPLWEFERRAWQRGARAIAGVDEAGRGPLAGPVVAAAVILDENDPIDGLNDSKQLSEKKRERLFAEIHTRARSVGVGIVSPAEIDRINILQATLRAMTLAVESLPVGGVNADLLLIDALTLPGVPLPQEGIIGGDAKSASIAAASIIAKVTRDRMMLEFEAEYPGYGFAGHKGYPTRAHKEAIVRLGPSPIHRRTFRGVVATGG
ncbi:MAG: ribonuclease HII [Nitrospirota bacterium]|nr:ribonuclease HII [Nitrospirota bacterium]